jgi:hypothetical protein
MYRITMKSGSYVETDDKFRIVKLSDSGHASHYECEPHDDWKILGIATRHTSSHYSNLSDCVADPSLIGQGWIHDLDHGTHRMWGMPKHRRAVRVEHVA